jgi:hypothetical protein
MLPGHARGRSESCIEDFDPIQAELSKEGAKTVRHSCNTQHRPALDIALVTGKSRMISVLVFLESASELMWN